jgi:DNA modification methylase
MSATNHRVYLSEHDVTLHHGHVLDVLPTLRAESVNCVVTSPPYYGLRDYAVPPSAWPEVEFSPMPGLEPTTVPAMTSCLGLEPTPTAFIAHIVEIFRQVHRVLRSDGVLWLNIGDSYAGKANGGSTYDRHRGHGHRSKQGIVPPRINNTSAAPLKSLIGIPWRIAFALQADGWIIRNAITWNKSNAMPEAVKDRLSSRHEQLFLLTKEPSYWFDLDPIREPIANRTTAAADLSHSPLPPPAHPQPPARAAGRTRVRILLGQHPRTHLRRDPGQCRSRILLSTAASDSEGTLGGLVALGNKRFLGPLLDRALNDAQLCSSDPLCAEHIPEDPSDRLHVAACHACLFASETSCESGNRWLHRGVLVDIADGLAIKW